MTKSSSTTEEGLKPFVPASYFSEGKKVSGIVLVVGRNENGAFCVLAVTKPILIGEDKCSEVSIGLKGFFLAVNANSLAPLLRGDSVTLECTGSRDVGKESDLITFSVTIERE